jgi:hypothetical protein
MDASRFSASIVGPQKEGTMSLELLAIDLGKRSFHIHGIDSDGVIISRKISRAKLIGAIEELAPAVIAMEACASAHPPLSTICEDCSPNMVSFYPRAPGASRRK